jgi:cell wall-associated NlpC family hydrolase
VSRHFRPRGALASVVAGVLLAVGAVAGPVAADDYPTWDDVLAARGDEAATKVAIAEIQDLLIGLEANAAAANKEAQLRGEAYNVAKVELDAAAAKSDALHEQADAAASRAEVSARKAGQLVAQLARTGTGSITLSLLVSPHADDLLDQLGTMTKVGEQASSIYRLAVVDRNLAQSLTDQAEIAEAARAGLEDEAQAALDAASAAADAANALVEQQQAASDQLYEQLATLKQTTAQVEQGYVNGLAAQPPPPPPNPEPADPGPATPPPPSNSGAAAGALAFAYAQLGDRYQFAGSGPDAWDCSGLTQAAYGSVGIYIGAHVVSSQYYTMQNQGRLVWYENMIPGDLLYYADGGTPGGFYHVAMYVGDGQMIEAPREGVPVRVTTLRYYDLIPYVGRPS